MDERKRQIKDQFKTQERAKAREAMPINDEQAEALFDHLDAELGEAECDHSMRLTDSWAVAQGIDAQKLRTWLAGLGGSCDCEALGNAEERWQESRQ